MKKYFVMLAVVAIAVIVSSCAKVPQAEIDAAVAALEQAKTAQANLYLEGDFNALQDSMNAINAAVEAQKGKLFGSFKAVKAKLATVTTAATELVAKTATRKEEIKTEVANAQAAIAPVVEENNKLLAKAPKGKEGREAIAAITSDLATITTSVAEVPAMVEAGDLLGAQAKINAATQKANSINTELKAILDKARIKY
jgi:hypothetical protein